MAAEPLPNYSVRELNAAIGNLLERGFAPRFLLHASVSKSQLKKGHQWLTLTDGDASINSVVWSSLVQKLTYRPTEGDGVIVVGKLNFWPKRASLCVQVLDIRPSLSTVLRKFEVVSALLHAEGLIDKARRRPLPTHPGKVAILTSVPSSALADMLRTSQERWPLTELFVIPIPVQGDVAKQIQSVLYNLANHYQRLGIEALVLARGGGSREDLTVFDDESLCRDLAEFPIPVVTGLGHEDDLTVADLVVDHRAATPTGAILALLPSRTAAYGELLQRRQRLVDHSCWLIRKERKRLAELRVGWEAQAPLTLIQAQRNQLEQRSQLLQALSPERWLARGFAIVRNELGVAMRSVIDVADKGRLAIHFSDGQIMVKTEEVHLNR